MFDSGLKKVGVLPELMLAVDLFGSWRIGPHIGDNKDIRE